MCVVSSECDVYITRLLYIGLDWFKIKPCKKLYFYCTVYFFLLMKYLQVILLLKRSQRISLINFFFLVQGIKYGNLRLF